MSSVIFSEIDLSAIAPNSSHSFYLCAELHSWEFLHRNESAANNGWLDSCASQIAVRWDVFCTILLKVPLCFPQILWDSPSIICYLPHQRLCIWSRNDRKAASILFAFPLLSIYSTILLVVSCSAGQLLPLPILFLPRLTVQSDFLINRSRRVWEGGPGNPSFVHFMVGRLFGLSLTL